MTKTKRNEKMVPAVRQCVGKGALKKESMPISRVRTHTLVLRSVQLYTHLSPYCNFVHIYVAVFIAFPSTRHLKRARARVSSVLTPFRFIETDWIHLQCSSFDNTKDIVCGRCSLVFCIKTVNITRQLTPFIVSARFCDRINQARVNSPHAQSNGNTRDPVRLASTKWLNAVIHTVLTNTVAPERALLHSMLPQN